MAKESEADRAKRIRQSKNFSDGKFHNPVERPLLQGGTWGMVKEHFFGNEIRVPLKPLPQVIPGPSTFTEPPHDLQVVWLGHSILVLEVEGKRILVDPVFENHASPVPIYAKRFQPPVLTREQLPRMDAILISHDHYDHLETESMQYFAGMAGNIPFLVPLGVGRHLERWGVDPKRIVELDWWEEYDLNGLRFICTPAQHFSGRALFDSKETLWASWTLIGKVNRVHYSGDGGYGSHFKEIGRRFGPFDLTLLENGAYGERWPYVHMFPEQGVQAHLDLGGDALMAVHWGMFSLANHDWFEPIRRISVAAREKGVRLLTPMLGEVVRPKENQVFEAWWEKLVPGGLTSKIGTSPGSGPVHSDIKQSPLPE